MRWKTLLLGRAGFLAIPEEPELRPIEKKTRQGFILPKLTLQHAWLLMAFLVVMAYVMTHLRGRYEVVMNSRGYVVKIDRWTGRAWWAVPSRSWMEFADQK